MKPAVARLNQRRLNQQGHTELRKKTSRLCEMWDEHLERSSRKTVLQR